MKSMNTSLLRHFAIATALASLPAVAIAQDNRDRRSDRDSANAHQTYEERYEESYELEDRPYRSSQPDERNDWQREEQTERQRRSQRQGDQLQEQDQQRRDQQRADRSTDWQRAQQRNDQQSADQQRSQRSQRQDQQRDDQQRMDQTQRGQRSQQRDQASRGIRVIPQGWITIGADYDNDGRFDALETIYVYDLQQAQQRSRQRANVQQQSNRNGGSDARQASSSQQQNADRRTLEISGTISDTKTERIAGQDSEFLIAHIDTDRGDRMCAVLGPKQKLDRLDLEQGDQIDVQGVRARLNDKLVVMADKVSHDGRSVQVDLPEIQRLKRARGTIESLRTVSFRGFDSPFVIAEVTTMNNRKQLVNLGPEKKLKKLELQEGDELRVLARPGTVNGQPAMIAQEIFANDKHVDVPRPDDSRKFQRRDRNRDRDEAETRSGQWNRQSRQDVN